MSQVAEAFVRIRPEATGFGAELNRQVRPQVARFENQLKSSNREMTRFGRGALVGTGALQGLGRAAAFASASFIGGAGLIYGIKSTIAAAMESQSVLAQTQNAVKRSGLSWDEYGKSIQAAALAQANLSGFDDERLLRTFSTLVRKTGDVNKALQLNALSADVARGRNIELEAATSLVIRASLGMSGALRRVGIAAKTNATPLELIQLLTEKYAGSAAKFGDTAAGAQARFGVALQNTQEIIGTALLPSITALLNKGTAWLNNTENQRKIQDNLNEAMRVGSTTARTLAEGIGDLNLVLQGTATYGQAAADALDKFGGKHFTIGSDLTQGLFSQFKEFKDFLARNPFGIGKPYGGNTAVNPALNPNALGPARPTVAEQVANIFASDYANAAGLSSTTSAGYRASATTRGDATATALAQAQAQGTKAQIIAAARNRLSFINDTIAFANKLISQGRGDTKQLQATLQKFYADKGSTLGIISQINEESAKAQKDAADAAKLKAQEAAQRLKDAQAASEEAVRAFDEGWKARILDLYEANKDIAQRRLDLQELTLQNNVERARLIPNTEKELAAEKRAQLVLVQWYKRRWKQLGDSTLEGKQAESQYLSALDAYRNLGKKTQASTGFSLAQLFQEATSELALYGSNIGAAGTPLSPQEARGAFAGTVKAHQTVVVQNFNYPRSASQALNDAHAGARNLKS